MNGTILTYDVLLNGTFTLSINEEVTLPIAVYDDGETIRSKLEALPSIGSLQVVRTASSALDAQQTFASVDAITEAFGVADAEVFIEIEVTFTAEGEPLNRPPMPMLQIDASALSFLVAPPIANRGSASGVELVLYPE